MLSALYDELKVWVLRAYRIFVETCWQHQTKIIRNKRHDYLGIQDKVGDAMPLLHKVKNAPISMLSSCDCVLWSLGLLWGISSLKLLPLLSFLCLILILHVKWWYIVISEVRCCYHMKVTCFSWLLLAIPFPTTCGVTFVPLCLPLSPCPCA